MGKRYDKEFKIEAVRLASEPGNTQAQVIGTLLMVVFCYLGAVLPLWSFAQPVNYVSFWIVTLGMVGGVIGMLIWHPGMGDFPAFREFTQASGPLFSCASRRKIACSRFRSRGSLPALFFSAAIS